MSGTAEKFMTLDRGDVSYDGLIEFERRMIEATKAGRVAWYRWRDGEYHYDGTKASVYLSERGVQLYDDSGRRVREFSYETNALYNAASEWFSAMANDVLDRILAELDALPSGGGGTTW